MKIRRDRDLVVKFLNARNRMIRQWPLWKSFETTKPAIVIDPNQLVNDSNKRGQHDANRTALGTAKADPPPLRPCALVSMDMLFFRSTDVKRCDTLASK